MRRPLHGLLIVTLLLPASLAAAQNAPAGGTGMGGLDQPMTAVTEPQIAATMAAIDRGEIEQGRYAEAHGASAQVRAFGRSMASMHAASGARLGALVRGLGITPTDDSESLQLTADSEATEERLARLNGVAFDRAYLDAQIAAHARALELLDRRLIPAARTTALRAALHDEVRPMVAAHLARARALRARY